MPDRAWLFLFSVFMVLAGAGAAAWLIVTGQALTMDGLFLLLVALLVALVFALYVKFLLRSAMESAAKSAQPARAGAAAGHGAAAKTAPPAPATQQAR